MYLQGFSFFAGYPLAIIYRRSVSTQTPFIQHLYFALTGIALIISNYGWDTVHSLTNIAVVYVVMLVAGRTKAALAFNFVFTMVGLSSRLRDLALHGIEIGYLYCS